MSPDPTQLRRLVDELVAEVNAAYGLYLDSTYGFEAIVRELDHKTGQSSITDDDSNVVYRPPKSGASGRVVHHITKVGALRERNSQGGRHYTLLARYIIVILHEQWEHTFRARIAAAASLPTSGDLKVSVFGDIRLLREEILHNKSRLSDERRRKLEVFKITTKQETIDPTPDDVYTIVMAVKAGLDRLVEEHTGVDPGYSKKQYEW